MRAPEYMYEIYLRILIKSYKWIHENEYFSFLFIECMMHTWNLFFIKWLILWKWILYFFSLLGWDLKMYVLTLFKTIFLRMQCMIFIWEYMNDTWNFR